MRFSEQPVAGLEIAYEGDLLHEERSAYQLIQVFEHPTFGRMLVLDGLVQTSTRDEFFYHEMLVHVPLLAHAEPRTVLIIGAGDGGALRRVLQHPSVEHVTMIEIDERVTAVSREYLPSISDGALDDPRADVRFADGHAFVLESTQSYDAIVVDSSDPVGPGIVLFETPFYSASLARLTEHGVLSAQIGSSLYFSSELRMAVTNARAAFPSVRPYLGSVPTYPGTLWSYMLCSRSDASAVDATRAAKRAADRGLQTRYWTPDVHAAAFALPAFVAAVAGGEQGPLE